MLPVMTKGGPGRNTQHAIRFLYRVSKNVSPSRTRLSHSFWSTPTSHPKLSSGWRSGLEKPGKKSSLKVGARKPEPALPRRRVPHALIRYDSDPRSVTEVPKTLLSSTRTPAAMKRRSKKRSCCWKKTEDVSVRGENSLKPVTSANSSRYSRPMVLVLHVPAWKWLSSSASRLSTSNLPGKSHGG